VHAIEQLREASNRLRLLEEHADDLDRRLRSAEAAAAEDRTAAERKVTLAEARALEAERRAEAAEARAAEAIERAELLLGVISEELGGMMPMPFGRGERRAS
jgi:septal ring factor EnvC (AmiA/AmiB activator)